MGGEALAQAVDRRRSPSTPSEWEQFRTGDDKARKKLTGFFVGLVMKATQGQADGKAVTAAAARASRSG